MFNTQAFLVIAFQASVTTQTPRWFCLCCDLWDHPSFANSSTKVLLATSFLFEQYLEYTNSLVLSFVPSWDLSLVWVLVLTGTLGSASPISSWFVFPLTVRALGHSEKKGGLCWLLLVSCLRRPIDCIALTWSAISFPLLATLRQAAEGCIFEFSSFSVTGRRDLFKSLTTHSAEMCKVGIRILVLLLLWQLGT